MEDMKIVELFLRRVEGAIQELDKKYGMLCRRITYNMLFNYEDTEEVISDTYYAVWKSIPPDVPRKLMPYVCRIAKNKTMDRLDYMNAKKRSRKVELPIDDLKDIVSGEMSIEDQYQKKVIVGYISDFLKSEPYKRREVFVKRYWYMDSIKDISKESGLSEKSVKNMLYNTKIKLKKYLEDRGVEV